MIKKTYQLILGATLLSVGFGTYQGRLSYLDIQNFEKQFNNTTFDTPQKLTSPIALENMNDLSIIPDDGHVTQAEKIIANVTENKVEGPDQAYRPTDKDPLHHLSAELKNSPAFEELTNFSRDELDVVLKSKDRAELARLSAQVIEQLQSCLKDGRCVEDVDPSSAYYREGHTRSHQLLERTMHTLIIIQEEDEGLRNNMSFESKLAVLDIDNAEIQRLGLELLGTHELSPQQVSLILSKDRKIDQEAQGALFTQLERYTRSQPELRQLYLEHLTGQFSKDAAAAIEILKVLPFARLEENEIAQVSRGLCQHQRSGASQNWQAIEFHHSLYQDSQGISTRLSSLCSAQ